MKRRIIIEHLPSSRKWQSNWEETEFKPYEKLEWISEDEDASVAFPSGCTDISIPSSILKDCVITTQYSED